jgi:phosphoglycolate phosphatase
VSQPPLLILDCDGVLVDSEPIAARCFSEALTELDIRRTPEELDRAFRGRRLDDCLRRVEQWSGRPLPADFRRRLQERTFARFERELEPVPGIDEALERIRAEGRWRLCVASGGEPEKIRLSLGLTGLDRHFDDALFSAQQVSRGKPAPDLFLHAARSMGVPPSDCIVVEDADSGFEAARAAGMGVIGYRPNGHPPPPPGVTHLARMDALPTLLGASGAGGGVPVC